MWIIAHDLAVFAGARLRFVGIDDEIGGPRRIGLRHEGPFEASREAGAAAAAQTRRLHLVDDPVLALFNQPFGVVPGTAGAGAGETRIAEAVEIGEDAIFI